MTTDVGQSLAMGVAEVIIFSLPTCPICRKTAGLVAARGVRYRLLDVSSDSEALRELIRITGRGVVPTVVAYGEVMVGLDEARLEEMLEGVEDRAQAAVSDQATEQRQLRESEEFVRNLPPRDQSGPTE